MSPSLVRYSTWLIAWGLTLTATLSIANLPGNWGHSICGAWGCGPPLQALWACHTSWLVVLLPLAIGMRHFVAASTQRRVAAVTLIVTLIGALGVGVHESMTWLRHASEWQRQYYWHRVGFVVLTTVELPLLEVGGLACVIWLRSLAQHSLHTVETVKTIEGVRKSPEPVLERNPELP